MPLEEFLLPKESVRYVGKEKVEFEGGFYDFYITNLRLILHIRQGLVFKKESIVSERLLEIKDIRYEERDAAMDKGILRVKTLQGKMDIIGSRDCIKAVLPELRKYKKTTEEEMCASLYLERSLAEVVGEGPVRSLARMIWKEAKSCCVCGDEMVSLWIINGADLMFADRPFAMVILARLFCRHHEKKWKEFKKLDYKKFNGLMILEEPYRKPLGIYTNTTPSRFSKLMSGLFKDEIDYTHALESLLAKTSELILKGKIDGFLEGEP